MKRVSNSQRTVYNFLTPIKMKFKSPSKSIQSENKQTSGVFTKITSFKWLGGKINAQEKIQLSQKQIKRQSVQQLSSNRLKFIKKLTNEHFLVGNTFKVDVMHLGGIIDEFVDTDYLWSLDFKKGLSNVAVDIKKCYLAFLIEKEVQIYQYNLKKSKDLPTLLTTIKTTGQVKFIQFAKDSYLTLFYQNNIEIYYIDQNLKIAKKRFGKQYNQPEGGSIFQVPQAFEGVINIFFTQPKVDTAMFHLWNLQVKLQKEEITMGSFLKIYDISNGLRQKIVLSNYSKEIFCMNLGHEILAVKKGYIIDTVNSNIENDYTVLRYLGNDRLIHVLKQKVQLYKFSINMNLNPPRIILQSSDSIWSKITDQTYVFLEVLQMLNDNIVVFYQINEQRNNSLSGQIKYAFNVTQKVKFEDKVRDILPSSEDLQRFKDNPSKKISDSDYELIEQKVDMAMKMGLTKKQIYLRLWNNSTKCDIEDYQFLLDTLDYETIRAEIQKKLKKKSMVLRQVIKIEEGCISMLQSKAFSHQTSHDSLKNFLISHFLLRKLKLYQMFTLISKEQQKIKRSKTGSNQEIQKEESQTIMINIKDYLQFAKCDLKAVLLQLVRQVCAKKKQSVLKIRTLIKLFKFSFRPIYSHLLEDMIKEAGSNLPLLLQSIPQLLPYQHNFQEEPKDVSLFQGIWGDILPEQWQLNLYVGGISTIDTKDIVEQIKKSVWTKRFFLTLHDLLPYQKAEIIEIHEKNKTQLTFYNFIEKIFYYINEKSVLTELVSFIQHNYQKLPRHLVGNIFLYKALYDYLKAQNILKTRLQKGQFNQFLRLKDFQICKLIFDLEKTKKNCILKDVKEGIYGCQQYVTGGNDIFNLALLNFFSSELSEISDIKYLLNRVNNEKIEFHSKNQGLYEVIVKGMQAKLYLGSDHDIPIDQVFIYITNIHIQSDSEIKKDLEYLKIINKYSEKLRRIKLNMNVFQIIRQMEKVLTKLINFEVQERKICQIKDDQKIFHETLDVLDSIESMKNDIYFDAKTDPNLVFFIYVTKILESEAFISKANVLLKSPMIIQRYQAQEIFIENAVVYMYKKKFSEDKIYKHNQTYIKELLTLLPQGNQTREFISDEIQLCIILSCNGNMIEYPVGGSNAILSTVELQTAIGFLPVEVIKEIDFFRIYQMSLKMQEISSDGKISSINLNQIYEIVLLRLLECNAIKDSIPFIRKIIQINPLSSYNFIYPVLLIKKFTSELCDENRAILLTILAYQFQSPDQLLDIVEKLLSTKSTSLEQKIILKGFLRKVQNDRKTYDKQNPIFNKDYIQALVSSKQQKAFASILRKTLGRIMQIKDQFAKNPQYAIIYTIILNNPYGIVKYLYCSRYESNFKGIRCFFSYLNKQQIFNKTVLLQLGKRVFKILHDGLSQTIYIQSVIDKYQRIPLTHNLDFPKIKPDCNLSTVMSKSIEKFKNKLKEELNQNKKKNIIVESPQERKQRIKNKISSQSTSIEQISNQYPFNDSDNQLTAGQLKLKKIQTNQITHVSFDPVFERQLLISRNQKNLGMYLSQEYTDQQKELFYSRKMQIMEIKNSVVKLKNKKKQMEDQYNLRMSARNSLIRETNQENYSSKNQSSLKRIESSEIPDQSQEDQVKTNIQPKQKQFEVTPFNQTTGNTKKQTESKEFHADPLIKQKNSIKQNKEQVQPSNNLVGMNSLQQKTQQKESSSKNFDSIIDEVLKTNDGENFNITPIKQAQLNDSQFKSLISLLYQSDRLTTTQVVSLIKKLSLTSTPALISKENLQVYVRMDSFQKRFTLEIDLKKMLPIEGIFLQSKSLTDLFSFFKQNIIDMLNDSNVYKITKVISLAFKNNQIEQQLNVSFLIKWLKELESNPIEDQKDLNRQKQKIKAFTDKIAIQQLNSKDQEILSPVSDTEFKNQLIETIVQAMKKKKNQQMANAFILKWKTN